VNAISLILCDSNGALVLVLGYIIFYLIYKMFGSERKLSTWVVAKKALACLVAGVFIVAAIFFMRNVTQAGFSQIMRDSKPVVVASSDDLADIIVEGEAGVTFEHVNKNIDSGRFKLWQQAAKMFAQNPVIGIGKGNIYEYGNRLFEGGIKFSDSYGILAPIMTDFHNGYITIIICSGVIGFVLFCIFWLRFFRHITVHVFREEGLSESVLPCMFAFICAYLIYSFIEVGLLFNLNFMVIFFWLIVGYTSCFLVKFEPDEELGTFELFGRTFRRSIL